MINWGNIRSRKQWDDQSECDASSLYEQFTHVLNTQKEMCCFTVTLECGNIFNQAQWLVQSQPPVCDCMDIWGYAYKAHINTVLTQFSVWKSTWSMSATIKYSQCFQRGLTTTYEMCYCTFCTRISVRLFSCICCSCVEPLFHLFS